MIDEDKFDSGDLELDVIKQRSATGIASLLLRTAFLQVVTFVTSIFISRFLDPYAFGVYGIVANFVFLFVYFSDIGLAAALVQKKEKVTRDDLKTTFTIQQSLILLIIVLIILFLPWAQSILNFDDDGLWLGRALSVSLLLASLKSIPSVLLERKLKFNLLIIPEIIETLVFNGVLVLCAVYGLGIKSFSFAVLARGISGLMAIFLLQPWRIGFGINRDSATCLVKFGAPFQLNSILAWFKDSLLDNVVALILRSPTSFGYLTWARNLSYQPKKIMDSIIKVTFPMFSRLQDRRDVLSQALSKTYFLLAITMFPLMAGICILARPFIIYLYGGEKWFPAIPSVYFMTLTLVWGLFNSVAINVISSVGKIKIVLKFMVMVTAVTWILTPFFAYRWGFNGAAISYVISGFVSLWSINKASKEVKINFWGDMKGAFLSIILMSGVLFVLKTYWINNLFQLVLTVLVGGLVYGTTLFFIERDRLLREINSLFELKFKQRVG